MQNQAPANIHLKRRLAEPDKSDEFAMVWIDFNCNKLPQTQTLNLIRLSL